MRRTGSFKLNIFVLWELTVSDLRHLPISGNQRTVRETEERGLSPHLSEHSELMLSILACLVDVQVMTARKLDFPMKMKLLPR